MKIKSIKTIGEFITKLEKLNITQNDTLFFRGEAKEHSAIVPSIYTKNEWIENEDKIFKEFILRNPNDFINEKTTFEKLVKMQHYSLPTRLLDITSNPLIALFFACERYQNEEDGHLVVFSIPDKDTKYYDSDTVSVISNISRRPIDKLDIGNLNNKKKKFNSTSEIQYLLHEIKEEKPYFKDIIKKEHMQKVVFVKPLLNNARIIKQDGAFLLFGINQQKRECAEIPENYILQTIPIDKNSKKTIMKNLEILGISKDKIYPEMDTTASYLKEKFLTNQSSQ